MRKRMSREPRRDLPDRTFTFALEIIKLCPLLAEMPGPPRILANQLLRSGTSIGANVQEGQASQSEADFLSKYSIACKEARETHYWLKLLAAADILPVAELNSIINECNELIAILTAIVKKLKTRKPAPKIQA